MMKVDALCEEVDRKKRYKNSSTHLLYIKVKSLSTQETYFLNHYQ